LRNLKTPEEEASFLNDHALLMEKLKRKEISVATIPEIRE